MRRILCIEATSPRMKSRLTSGHRLRPLGLTHSPQRTLSTSHRATVPGWRETFAEVVTVHFCVVSIAHPVHMWERVTGVSVEG